MRRTAAEFAFLMLNDGILNRFALCIDMQDQATEVRSYLSKVTMGYKSWVCVYDPEMKQQSSQ